MPTKPPPKASTKPSLNIYALEMASAWWQGLAESEKIAVFDGLYNKAPSVFFRENEIRLSAAEDDDILIDSLKSSAGVDRDDLEEKIENWKASEDLATEVLEMLNLDSRQIWHFKNSSDRERTLLYCLKGTI